MLSEKKTHLSYENPLWHVSLISYYFNNNMGNIERLDIKLDIEIKFLCS